MKIIRCVEARSGEKAANMESLQYSQPFYPPDATKNRSIFIKDFSFSITLFTNTGSITYFFTSAHRSSVLWLKYDFIFSSQCYVCNLHRFPSRVSKFMNNIRKFEQRAFRDYPHKSGVFLYKTGGEHIVALQMSREISGNKKVSTERERERGEKKSKIIIKLLVMPASLKATHCSGQFAQLNSINPIVMLPLSLLLWLHTDGQNIHLLHSLAFKFQLQV